jgi:transposase
MSYSYDLRLKAMGLIEEGLRITKISKLLKISRDTLHKWKKRKIETGDVEIIRGYQKGYGNKVTDLKGFKEFIDQNQGKTLAELASLWPEAISARTMGKYIKAIGYTRKKRLMATVKEEKRKE